MVDFGGAQDSGLKAARTACVAILLSIVMGCGGSNSNPRGGEAGTGGSPECNTSEQCVAPEVCEPVTQICVAPLAACMSQAECTGGTYCQMMEEVCLPSSVGTPCAGPDNCNEECLDGFCGCSGVAHERQLESSPLDIYLVLDRTGSMGDDCAYVGWGHATGQLEGVLRNLRACRLPRGCLARGGHQPCVQRHVADPVRLRRLRL